MLQHFTTTITAISITHFTVLRTITIMFYFEYNNYFFRIQLIIVIIINMMMMGSGNGGGGSSSTCLHVFVLFKLLLW